MGENGCRRTPLETIVIRCCQHRLTRSRTQKERGGVRAGCLPVCSDQHPPACDESHERLMRCNGMLQGVGKAVVRGCREDAERRISFTAEGKASRLQDRQRGCGRCSEHQPAVRGQTTDPHQGCRLLQLKPECDFQPRHVACANTQMQHEETESSATAGTVACDCESRSMATRPAVGAVTSMWLRRASGLRVICLSRRTFKRPAHTSDHMNRPVCDQWVARHFRECGASGSPLKAMYSSGGRSDRSAERSAVVLKTVSVPDCNG